MPFHITIDFTALLPLLLWSWEAKVIKNIFKMQSWAKKKFSYLWLALCLNERHTDPPRNLLLSQFHRREKEAEMTAANISLLYWYSQVFKPMPKDILPPKCMILGTRDSIYAMTSMLQESANFI